MYTLEDIQAVDMEVAQAITDELDRQNSHIAVSYTHLSGSDTLG